MKAFFEELFEYNLVSNHKLLALLHEHSGAVSERTLKLFNHILNAHHIWTKRIEQETPGIGVWDVHGLEDLNTMNDDNHTRTRGILERMSPEQEIAYTNSKGDAFQNTIRDILFHVINHSTYHRGQIASDLKAGGIVPPGTDFILFKR